MHCNLPVACLKWNCQSEIANLHMAQVLFDGEHADVFVANVIRMYVLRIWNDIELNAIESCGDVCC